MVVMVCTTYEYTEMHRIVYFKRLNFIVYIVFKKPSAYCPRAAGGPRGGDLCVSFLQTPHRHGAQGEADPPL